MTFSFLGIYVGPQIWDDWIKKTSIKDSLYSYWFWWTVLKSKWSESVIVVQSCPTLCGHMDYSPTTYLCPWNSPGENTGAGCHCLLRPFLLHILINTQFHILNHMKKSNRSSPAKKKKIVVKILCFPICSHTITNSNQVADVDRLTGSDCFSVA